MSDIEKSVNRPETERQKIPEKNEGELYYDALEKKRDTLLAFHAMRPFRKGKKVGEMTAEEIESHNVLKADWQSKKESSLISWDALAEDKQEELAALGSRLYDVQAKLTLMGEDKVSSPEIRVRPEDFDVVGETKIRPETESQGPTELGEIKLDERAENIALEAINREIKKAEERVQFAKDTGRVPGIGPQGLSLAEKELSDLEAQKALILARMEADAKDKKIAQANEEIADLDKKIVAKETKIRDTEPHQIWVRRDAEMELDYLKKQKERLEKDKDKPGFGKRFKDWVKKKFNQTKETSEIPPTSPEKQERKASAWGFIKERLKGFGTLGFYEVGQAERFRIGTKETGEDVKALATQIKEQRNLSPEEAETEAWEIVRTLKEQKLDISAPEFFKVSQDITAKKEKENNEEIEYIIKSSWKQLGEKLKKYRGESGESVLTEENRRVFEAELRGELGKLKDGAIKKDSRNYAKLIRQSVDSKYWHRYVYGGLEGVLDGLLIGFIGAKVLAWKGVAAMGGKIGAKEAAQIGLKDTIWGEAKRQLVRHGIVHPTNVQIQQIATQIAKDSGVKVISKGTGQVLWNQTAGGVFKDVALQKGFLLKLGGAVKKIAAIKAGLGA